MAGKLFIYDTGDPDNVDQARGRFSKSADVTTIATDSIDGLRAGLDGLLRRRATFDRVLFQTHGRPGIIYFGKEGRGKKRDEITPSTWFVYFRVYQQLFPFYTRIYFDGCEVGANEAGTRFLTEAGQAFTHRSGGEVFAFTNAGYGFPGSLPFIGGHTMHFGGPLKKVYLLAGGIVVNVQAPSIYHSVIA